MNSDSGFIDDNTYSITLCHTYNSVIEIRETGGMRRVFKKASLNASDSVFTNHLLEKEYSVMAILSHPGICSAIALHSLPGDAVELEMEYIDGDTLGVWLSKNHDETLRRSVALRLLEAVAYMHSKGVVHRDLKPENIMVTHDGNFVKIIDFGLAETSAHTRLKQPAGTPGYVSPRQLQGLPTCITDDFHSLSVVLSGMLSDRASKRVVDKLANPAKPYATLQQAATDLKKGWQRRSRIITTCAMIAIMVLTLILALSISHQMQEKRQRQLASQVDSISQYHIIRETIMGDSLSKLNATLRQYEERSAKKAHADAQHARTLASIQNAYMAALDEIWTDTVGDNHLYTNWNKSRQLIEKIKDNETQSLSPTELTGLESALNEHHRKLYHRCKYRKN